MKQTEITFVAPTQNTDGSSIAEPLSYNVYIDTVQPPAKVYPSPAGTPSTPGASITLTFAALGFTPTPNTKYYVDVESVDADGVSTPSASVSFTYAPAPNAPTGLTVG
ncbi:MAG: hypothetical protein KGL39_42660 [Patescibacteria group bacterium]|nr:hypothetical protein [Patescibacteria group bacterium]